jgi:HEAT repeat protein
MQLIATWRGVIAAAACLAAAPIAAATAQGQQVPTAKDLSAVIEMLRSPDPVVRVGVACQREVFDSNATPAIPALIDLLDDAEPVSPEVCRKDRRQWWGDEQPLTPGQEAARALVRIGIASFDPLVKALGNSEATARRNAAWALGALDDPRAVPPLIKTLRETDEKVREQAAWALGALDDAKAVQALVSALRDSAATVRRQTAWALGAIDDSAAVAALIAALKDADADVREQAAWALGAIDDSAAVDGLVAALKDADAEVREQAAWALGTIGDARASAALSLALKDTASEVRRQAAWALGAIAN